LPGLGLAYFLADTVQEHITAARLVQVPAAWCPPYPDRQRHYPSYRQPTPAFSLLVATLRCKRQLGRRD
jgi:hypothetical protein